uniref:Uncharacterized protein n=2 Tax=Oryza TaxID=4527 RepID=A0A0D3FF72_9ORYZ
MPRHLRQKGGPDIASTDGGGYDREYVQEKTARLQAISYPVKCERETEAEGPDQRVYNYCSVRISGSLCKVRCERGGR